MMRGWAILISVGLIFSGTGCSSANVSKVQNSQNKTDVSLTEETRARVTQDTYISTFTASLTENPGLSVTEFKKSEEKDSIIYRADLLIKNNETNLLERCGSINVVKYKNDETMSGVILGGGISATGFFAPYVLKSMGLTSEEIQQYMEGLKISNTSDYTSEVNMFGITGNYRYENKTELFVATYN